ncbi:hypothetical protein ACFL9T_07310 [Thermodesulfobacteriota bacterium]
MPKIKYFIIRLVVSLIIAFFIGHFFFQGFSLLKILGLAGAMLVLAYLFEFTRKRDEGDLR